MSTSGTSTPTTSENEPSTQSDPGWSKTWTRRSVLGTLSAAAVGTMASAALPAWANGPGPRGHKPHRPHHPHPPKGGLGSGDAPTYTPVAPFALTADAELTEDYFAFQTHQIAPEKDTVIAYSRADGEVEAMLLQAGAVKQIYRDPTQSGGWNVYTFPDASAQVIDMVAGVSRRRPDNADSSPGDPVLKVFYRNRSNPDLLYVAVADSGQSRSFTTTSVPWSSNAGPLQINVGFDDSLVVTAMIESSSLTATDGQLFVYTDSLWGEQDAPTYGSLTGFSYYTAGVSGPLPPSWSATLVKVFSGETHLMLALPAGTYGPYQVTTKLSVTPPSLTIWSWELQVNRPSKAAMSSYIVQVGYPPAPTPTTTAYSIEYATALGSYNYATLVVRTLDSAGGSTSQHLWVLSPSSNDGAPPQWTWTELLLPSTPAANSPMVVSTSISPLPSSEKVGSPENDEAAARRFMDTFVLADGTFSVIRQAPQGNADTDYAKPVYCPAIPLQTGVAAMTSQANVSSGNELLVVGDDNLLQYLVKDPVSGMWVDNPVHLPAADVEETSTYRVTLSVVDAWQAAVTGQSLSITATSQVTALLNGTALELGDTAVTVTTDEDGQVIVALLADGLGAPTLTVSGDGVPTATVNPSSGVNSYLQGGTSLNYLSPMSAATLASAQNADGSPLAPGANDSGAAQDAVQTMAQATGQAAGQVGTLTLSSRRVHVKHRRDGRLRSRSKAQLTGVRSDLGQWANDALHGIKKGAIAVKEVKQIVDDAGEKAFAIATDIANWAGGVVNVVVKTMEDAAHVVHALLVKLGAEIKKAVLWLRTEVIGLLQDAAALGDQYLSWLQDCCTFAAKQVTAAEGKVDAWLSSTKDSLTNKLTTIAQGYASSTTLDSMADNPPRNAVSTTRSPRGSRLGAEDGSDVSELLHGDWFWSKIKHELSGELNLPPIEDLLSKVAAVLIAAEEALKEMLSMYGIFWDFLEASITNPSTVLKVLVHDLLLTLVKLIDAVFNLAQKLSDALLGVLADLFTALPTILETKANTTPLLGGLMAKIGRTNTTVGQHAATHFAFRAVLSYRLAHGGKGRPFGSSQPTGRRLGASAVSTDLQVCAGAALTAWAWADCRAQLSTMAKADPGVLSTAIDVAAPVIVGALTVPSTNGGQPYFTAPITSGSSSSELENFLSWICSMAPGLWTLMGYYCEKTGKDDPDLPGQKRMVNFATFVCGALSLALGCAGNHDSDNPSGVTYAVDVLSNMSYLVVPLLDDDLVKASDGISAGIAAITTLLTGQLGGFLTAIP